MFMGSFCVHIYVCFCVRISAFVSKVFLAMVVNHIENTVQVRNDPPKFAGNENISIIFYFLTEKLSSSVRSSSHRIVDAAIQWENYYHIDGSRSLTLSYRYVLSTYWQGNAFGLLAFCDVHYPWIPLPKVNQWGAWMSLRHRQQRVVELTIELSVIWNALTQLWRQSIGTLSLPARSISPPYK